MSAQQSTTPPSSIAGKGAAKPQLNFWQIWNMCFGFLGIQFGFALQNANVSRIFQTLGADIDDIPILWIAAPVTGLIVQPIIGYLSDNTWNSLGRRRPYFLYGALLASAAIFIMPNSPTLWIAAGMLWIMDASINISMEPFRAFVGDMLPEKQRPSGFAMQSFFIGIGSVVASALPWIFANWMDVSNVAPAGEIPNTVKYAFYFGGVVLFLAVMWTIMSTKEYTPEQLAEFEATEKAYKLSLQTQAQQDRAQQQSDASAASRRTVAQYHKGAFIWLMAGVLFSLLVNLQQLDKQLYILSIGAIVFAVIQLMAGRLQAANKTDNGFSAVIDDLFHMPTTMKQLAVVQFFSWFALFAMWIYTTSAVSQVHFHATDTSSAAFNDGANWVGILFAAYNGFAALAAIVIPKLVQYTNLRVAHLINLLLGGLGLVSFLVIKDPDWLLLSMVGVGFAWASILSLPYAMLSNSLPAHKMGVFMGIFNFFIVIPQILAASILGFLVKTLFSGEPIYALVIGGVSLVIAGVMVLRVEDESTESLAALNEQGAAS
ncbi:MAG: maltose/moltooligosaccharide transporter [Phenylobacterium sp.]|jgi:maltose/moltooligosaccharide transporter